MTKKIEVQEGSGNIFADMVCPIPKSVSRRPILRSVSPKPFVRGG